MKTRLGWLEEGDPNDPERDEKTVRDMSTMTMYKYFAGKRVPLERMAKRLGVPVEDFREMAYAQVAMRIAERQCNQETCDDAEDAMWDLALPYLLEGKRRASANDSSQS